jgi:protein TonB
VIDSRQNRVFHYAILASLALHALLLFAFDNPDRASAARFPPPIIARLLEPEPAAPPAVAAETPPAAPVKKAQPPKAAVAKPAPQPALTPESPREDPTAEAGAGPVAAAEPEAAPPSIASVQPAPAPAAASSAEAPESLSRDQYRLQLIDEARRHKRYPPLARENNWQGDVLVAVVVGANGRASVTLKGSSGYEVLDRQALEMFRQATRAVAVPPTLRGKEFALDVRAVYGLED